MEKATSHHKPQHINFEESTLVNNSGGDVALYWLLHVNGYQIGHWEDWSSKWQGVWFMRSNAWCLLWNSAFSYKCLKTWDKTVLLILVLLLAISFSVSF